MGEIKLDKFYLEFVSDANYFYCRQAETTNHTANDYYLDIIDRKSGEVIKSLLPITLSPTDLGKPKPFGNFLRKSTSNSILMSSFEREVIYEISGMEAWEKYVVDFKMTSNGSDNINIVNVTEAENSMLFSTSAGLFLYRKDSGLLTGYKYSVMNKGVLNATLNQLVPVGNRSDKIAFAYYPAFLKNAEDMFRNENGHGFQPCF